MGGRYAGTGSTINAMKKKLAHRFGVPISNIPRGQAAKASGMAIERFHEARPGAVIRVAREGTLSRDRSTVVGLERALKRLKKFNPATGKFSSHSKKKRK